MSKNAAMAWIVGHDTGISSKAIWARMMGVAESSRDYGFGNYPLDPDDFGRCYRLFEAVPAWKARIGEMATEGAVWAALAENWNDLTALYEAEVNTAGRRHTGPAPRLYARLREIENAFTPGLAHKGTT